MARESSSGNRRYFLFRRRAAIAAAQAPIASTARLAGSGTDVPPPPPGGGGHHDGTTLHVVPASAEVAPTTKAPATIAARITVFIRPPDKTVRKSEIPLSTCKPCANSTKTLIFSRFPRHL